MKKPYKSHQFYSTKKGGPGRKRDQTKAVRRGARFPGSGTQGSIRRPF